MDPEEQIQEIIRSLEAEIEQEYTHDLLVKQHTLLLEFLGLPYSNFHRLQGGHHLPIEGRVQLFQPIADWFDANVSLFPEFIQGMIRRIHALAGTWVSDHGLKTVPPVEAISAFKFDWDLLREYEGVLRRALVRAERSKASVSAHKDQTTQDSQDASERTAVEREASARLVESQDRPPSANLPPPCFESPRTGD